MTIEKNPPASEAILKLSSILRYMLYGADKKLVDLHDELEILKDYIELQKLRLPGNVTLNHEIKGEIGSQRIAPLLLIPLAENAFKFGVDNIGKSFIGILVSVSAEKFEMLARNNIVRHVNRIDKDSGIGIKNIRRRLELLYPGKHNFEITEDQNIFTVKMQIELEV